jgi:hypothetical protein
MMRSTSLAIISVCRSPDGDEDAEFLAVQWGTVCHETAVVPGHCYFSSQELENLRERGRRDWLADFLPARQ